MQLIIEPNIESDYDNSVFFSTLFDTKKSDKLKLCLLPSYRIDQLQSMKNTRPLTKAVIGTKLHKIDPFTFIRGSYSEKANQLCDLFNLIQNNYHQENRLSEYLLLCIILIEIEDSRFNAYVTLNKLLLRIQEPKTLIELLTKIKSSQITLTNKLAQSLEHLQSQLKSVKKNQWLNELNLAANKFQSLFNSPLYQSLFSVGESNLKFDQVSFKDITGTLLISTDMAPDNLNLLLTVMNKLKLCQYDLYLDASAYSTNQIASILYQHDTDYSSLTVLVTEGHMSLPALTQLSHHISMSTNISNYSAWINLLMERMHTNHKEQKLLNTAIGKGLITHHLGYYTALTTDDSLIHQIMVQDFTRTVINDRVSTEVKAMDEKERQSEKTKKLEPVQAITDTASKDIASSHKSSIDDTFRDVFSK
ncbi:hypothetical protein [Lactiplantibacillus plantarum]|uniref:hypothetical protein n=1 Tax=Lactiplantibacillus plantarum TaxID=1590 RepID=UPI001BA64CD6|nr:hypothetical protein [Lactiplantibacillus plantarum]MBS0954970.1 hypothetical protein [Lactiplantibacillus plantarum]